MGKENAPVTMQPRARVSWVAFEECVQEDLVGKQTAHSGRVQSNGSQLVLMVRESARHWIN